MLRSFLIIFALLSFFMICFDSAYAQRGVQSPCDEIFASYAGDKDFMSMNEFQQYWNESGNREQAAKGDASVITAGVTFLKASGGSFQMSKSEFCHWLKYSPEAQR